MTEIIDVRGRRIGSRRRVHPSVKAIAGLVAGLSSVGAALGVWSEIDRNDVASGQAYTANACISAYGTHTKTITKPLLECLSDGAPGGNNIDQSFEIGQPVALVKAYQSWQEQQSHFNTTHVIEWAIGAPVVATAVVLIF